MDAFRTAAAESLVVGCDLVAARDASDQKPATVMRSPIWGFCCRRIFENPPGFRVKGAWGHSGPVWFPDTPTPQIPDSAIRAQRGTDGLPATQVAAMPTAPGGQKSQRISAPRTRR